MIIGIGMVKNEADIIEAFVRHNLHYLDSIHLIENGSQDKTPQVLARLQAEGLPLQVTTDPGFKYNQAFRTTALYRQALQAGADFVVPLDADEFIQAPSREQFRFLLETIPPNGIGKWRWRTCVPTDLTATALEQRFAKARRHENPHHSKVILRAPRRHDPSLEIMQGSHNATRSGRRLRAVIFEDMHLAHLPVRSIPQLTRKVILGWMANVAQFKSTNPACGFHWGTLYRRALELSAADLLHEAYNYATNNSDTAYDLIPSGLVLQCKAQLPPGDTELNLRELLEFLCRSWEASLMAGA